jgi:hypothetical protein
MSKDDLSSSAVWHVDHGENYSGRRPYGLRKGGRYLTVAGNPMRVR